MKTSPLLLLPLALAACGPAPPPVSPEPPPRKPPVSAPTPGQAPRVAPYAGEVGSCSLDGLPMALYSSRDPRWGKPEAPVALIVFSDFECPFCAKFRHSLDDIKGRFGPERVQILWKNMPLRMHPHARPAAEAAQAVFEGGGSEAFWRFHDLVFSNRKTLSPELLPRLAAEAGLPEERLRQALAGPSVPAKVEEDMALAKAIGLQGTPMTILNGLPLEGAQDAATIATAVDEELHAIPSSGASPHHACDRMRIAWAPN